MVIGQSPITEAERAARQTAVSESAATNLLEGLVASAEAQHVFNLYASGEIDLDEMGLAIDALNEQKFGPVSPSRD